MWLSISKLVCRSKSASSKLQCFLASGPPTEVVSLDCRCSPLNSRHKLTSHTGFNHNLHHPPSSPVHSTYVTLPAKIGQTDTFHGILNFTDLYRAFIFLSNDTKIMQMCLQVQRLLINQSGYRRKFHSEKLG